MKTRGAILVTGASTGIGRACALRLDKGGYRVFATALCLEEGAELQSLASPNLEIVVLDLRDADSIASALKTVSHALENAPGNAGMSALINNAGILSCAPLELLSMRDVRQVFEVNVLGQIAVTQAFLPLLRRGKGRIINLGSLAGRTALPFTSPYNASKWALRALSDTWRLELKRQGISVVLIEPGMVKTPIWNLGSATASEMTRGLTPEVVELYPTFRSQSQQVAQMAHKHGVAPEQVADVIWRALQAPKPRARYLIGKEARLLIAVEMLPTPLRDWLVARRFTL